MQRLRVLTLTSLAVLSSCTPPDSALRVSLTVRMTGSSRVRADCVRLSISDQTQELKSLTIKRPTSDTAVFAVLRGSDLPGTVKVQASGFLGSNCADDSTLKLNAQGDPVTGIFPQSGVNPIEVFLDPPNASLDADRDGYVAAGKGGPDCRDDDKTIFPGAGQVCANTADTDCNGLGGCDDTQCTTAAVCLDPPDRVQVSTSIATMLRYECRGPFRVELRNATGPRLAIRDTAVALQSSLPGVTVHGVGSCNDLPLSSLPIPYGQSFFEVYLQADGQAFGITTLKATAAQVATPGTAMVEVHPQPIDHLEFTSPPRTVSAGQCSPEAVTLEFRDLMNRRTDVDAPTTITLASAPGDLGNANIFFSDVACAADGSLQQIQPGQGTLALHLKAGRAGTFTLTATPSTGTGKTQPLTVQPAAGTQLAFTNGPLVLNTTQSCSAGQFTVQLQDPFQNPASTAAALPIRLSVSGLSNVQLFDGADPLCSAAAQTDFTIPAGSNSISLRAKGMTASATPGDIRAAVLNGAPITDATQVLRISAGSASKFRFTGNAQSPLANICSANPFSVELLDSADNPASSSTAVTFALTTLPAPDPSFRFYSGAGCLTDLVGNLTVPPGQTSAQFYYRGNKAVANFEIRAASTLTAPATFLSGNSIRAAAPGKLVFTAPLSQTAQAGTCTPSPYLASVLDLFDNPTSFTAAQTVTVTSNPVGVTVGSSTCNAGNSVPLAAGSSQVSFIAQHTVTTPYALTASVSGFSSVTAATLNVTPGPSTLMVDVPLSGTSSLAAGACQAITLTRRDVFNNNAPTAGATPVTLSFPAATTWVVYSSSNCTTGAGAAISMNSTHTVTFSVSPRTSGSHQMSASILSGAQTVLVNFQVAAGAPTLVFETPNTGLGTAAAAQVVGGCTPVTVARKDPWGNDVPLGAAGNLTFGLAPGTTAHSAASCLVGNAISSLPLTATDARATFYLRATVSAVGGGPQAQAVTSTLASQTANLTLTVSPGAPVLALVLPAGNTATLTANQCLAVTVERRDSFGNLVPVSATTNLTITPAGLSTFSFTDCTGASTLSVPAGASSRAFSVRTTLASAAVLYTLTLDTQTVPLTLTVNSGPTTRLAVEGLPATLTARGCTGALTVRRLDAWNNNVTAETGLAVTLSSTSFTFSSQATCASPTTGGAVTIANGVSTSAELLYATASLAGAATATADATAPSGPVTGNASTTVQAGPASKLIISTAPGTATAGLCSGSLQVELKDQDNNPVTPAVGSPFTVTLGSTPNAPTFFPAAACSGTLPLQLTNLTRVGTFSFLPTTAPASELISASGVGVTAATQSWTINVGAPTKLAWKTNPVTPAARFGCVSAGVLQLQDSSSNVALAGVATTVTPTPSTPSSSGVTFFSDVGCTTPISTLSIGAAASETAQFFMLSTGANPTLSATSVPALTAAPNRPIVLTGTGSLVVTPADPALEAGACLALTVERHDNLAAVFTRGTTTVNLSVPTTTPQSVTLHLLADCSDAAQALPLARTIANGASATLVYARGRSAAPTGSLPTDSAFTAVDALGGVTASGSGLTTLKVYPLVRRGTCNIAPTTSSTTCPLVPPLPGTGTDISRSFLVFTSTGTPLTSGPRGLASDEQSVECHLDTSGPAAVVCSRVSTGGNSTATMNVNYQVVSWGRDFASGAGVTVQHFPLVATSATSTNQAITGVDTTRSFVLASSKFSGASDGDAFPVVHLTSSGNVEIVTNTTAAHTVSLQVVSFAGATVVHDDVTVQLGAPTVTVSSLPTTTPVASTFVLGMAQVSADVSSANLMCKRRFKGRVTTSSDVTFRRGANAAGSTCSLDGVALLNAQRISIPTALLRIPADVTITGSNTLGSTAAFTAVTTHKSIALTGMQGPGGQCAGEGAYAGTGSDNDDSGSFHALLDFDATGTQVNVTRTAPQSNANSVFAPFVVQFDP